MALMAQQSNKARPHDVARGRAGPGREGGGGETDASRAAADEFEDDLIHMLLMRAITAELFCTIMHRAVAAGPSLYRKRALGKAKGTGHYSRHCETHIPLFKEQRPGYAFDMPSTGRLGARVNHSLHMLVPTEEIQAEFDATPDMEEKLMSAIDSGVLPRSYDDNPVVLQSTKPVIPFGLFVDGAAYSLTDSTIGIWMINLITRRRHLIGSVRSSLLCACGCRGYCSLFSVFYFLACQFQLLADAVHALARHDGKPWSALDRLRSVATHAGQAMTYAVCLVFLQCDWAEYAKTFAFPAWNDLVRPCFGCNGFGEMLQRLRGVSSISMPSRSNDEIDYFTACDRCEIRLQLDAADHAIVCASLFYDKRSGDGGKGRCVRGNLALSGNQSLQVGDRLEPSATLLNVGDFDAVKVFPYSVVFWRPSSETMARHRNPIFNLGIGLTPRRVMTVDLLHTFYLGLFQRFCRIAAWILIQSGIFGAVGTMDQRVQVSILALANMLGHWYKRRHRLDVTEKLTRIHNLQKGRLGDNADPQCKTKAAETWGFMLFLLDTLRLHINRLPARARTLVSAGEALVELMGVFDAASTRLTGEEIQHAWDCYGRFGALTDHDEEWDIPKRHLAVHMLERLPDLGNPKGYANWLNEAYNRQMKLSCRTVSQVTFEPSLLVRMREIMRRCNLDLEG